MARRWSLLDDSQCNYQCISRLDLPERRFHRDSNHILLRSRSINWRDCARMGSRILQRRFVIIIYYSLQ
jgi:hypothetical protein